MTCQKSTKNIANHENPEGTSTKSALLVPAVNVLLFYVRKIMTSTRQHNFTVTLRIDNRAFKIYELLTKYRNVPMNHFDDYLNEIFIEFYA